MAKCVFVHRPDSKYDDIPELRYQFPKRYLARAALCVGDMITYYEPKKFSGRMGYYAIARVLDIVPDSEAQGRYVANIDPQSYRELDQFVPSHTDGRFIESELETSDGGLNRGRVQWAVRPISDSDFRRILDLGFPHEYDVLPRTDGDFVQPNSGFKEAPEPFMLERPSIEQLVSRIPRDRVFRKKVLAAYDNTCALTGLRLINGGGRAEVEAAHIRPVKDNGPDSPRNGIALSGTVHWLFDRGLVSLSDDMDILVSRYANNPSQVWSMMNCERRAVVPENPSLQPHPVYLDWHRQNCFKH